MSYSFNLFLTINNQREEEWRSDMEPRLQIRYPRSWTETMEILNNLNLRLQKINQNPDRYRRGKDWIQIVYEINTFSALTEKKIIASKELLEDAKKNKNFIQIMKEGLNLNFYQRTQKAIDGFMFQKRIPKTK